jgi:hypothetical protein
MTGKTSPYVASILCAAKLSECLKALKALKTLKAFKEQSNLREKTRAKHQSMIGVKTSFYSNHGLLKREFFSTHLRLVHRTLKTPIHKNNNIYLIVYSYIYD